MSNYFLNGDMTISVRVVLGTFATGGLGGTF
jgi:hypothetical protein